MTASDDRVRPRPDGDILVEVRESVAMVTLHREHRRNAITLAMLGLLGEIFAEIDADPSVHAAVIAGAGPVFCAGGDLTELIPRVTSGGLAVAIPDRTKRMLSDVRTPIVAAVDGACLAGGLELLLGTDLRVATPDAAFGAPEVSHGLFAAGGTHVRLSRQVSFAAAQELLLTGLPIGADRALQIGLINAVVPREDLLPEAFRLAGAIAANGPVAVRAAKEAMVSMLGLEQDFRTESLIGDRVFASADAREGLAAFAERRKPRFSGA